DSVVVNASDLASRPPDSPSYLTVNWGDGPNQRIGCGPCRADHLYASGRYTLQATADDIASSSQARSSASRSITLQVQVTPVRDRKRSRFAAFGFYQHDFNVGDSVLVVLPFPPPAGVTINFVFFQCQPFNTLFPDFANPPGPVAGGIGFYFTATAPGGCT